MTKQNKSILSALALVVIFAAWLILQRTGAGGGTPAPVLDSPEPLELPAAREGEVLRG